MGLTVVSTDTQRTETCTRAADYTENRLRKYAVIRKSGLTSKPTPSRTNTTFQSPKTPWKY